MMASVKSLVVIGLGSGMTMLLQGCGGGGGKTTTTTTTTTTTSMHARTKPLSSADAAKYLNELYLGFDAKDNTSLLGVTASMAADVNSFFGNIFCSQFADRPGGRSKCFKGQADCRLSASLYSHAWGYDPKTKKTLMGLSRQIGYAFNQSMVESRWAKCSYIWDGASMNKYNRGCGEGAPGATCEEDVYSAYRDICKSTNKICTASDPEVKLAACKQYPGGRDPVPLAHDKGAQCYFPGPSLNYHDQNSFEPNKDDVKNMRDMATLRVQYNEGKDTQGVSNYVAWNEVVLDELLLLPDMWYDPAPVLTAFLYTKGGLPISKNLATQVRDDFCKFYKISDIPLVMVDDTADSQTGIFLADTSDASTMVV